MRNLATKYPLLQAWMATLHPPSSDGNTALKPGAFGFHIRLSYRFTFTAAVIITCAYLIFVAGAYYSVMLNNFRFCAEIVHYSQKDMRFGGKLYNLVNKLYIWCGKNGLKNSVGKITNMCTFDQREWYVSSILGRREGLYWSLDPPASMDIRGTSCTECCTKEPTNKLAKLGDAIAISKSETINHSLTDPLTDRGTC